MLIGIAFLFWVSIRFAIIPTFHLKNDVENTSTQLNSIEDAPMKLQMIQRRIQDIEKQIGDVSGMDANGNYLIDDVGSFCKKHGLVLSEIPEKHTSVKDQYQIVTYKIKVRGTFIPLMKLLHQLEQNASSGKVRSVEFVSEFDLKKKRKYLEAIFYIQSIVGEKV